MVGGRVLDLGGAQDSNPDRHQHWTDRQSLLGHRHCGFVPTKEFTAELFVRWFQFGAFCPLFRSHGRTWKLHLPWGWSRGETGPTEFGGYEDTAAPDPGQLRNPQVERHHGSFICRRENGTTTGLASVLQASAKSRVPWIWKPSRLCSRGSDSYSRSSETICGRESGPAMDDFYLSWRGWFVPAL